MRVTVDPERCQGHALCAITAPDLFVTDDDTGHATARRGTVPRELEALAHRAATGCPEQAIVIHASDDTHG